MAGIVNARHQPTLNQNPFCVHTSVSQSINQSGSSPLTTISQSHCIAWYSRTLPVYCGQLAHSIYRQPSYHTFQLLSNHGISPCLATLCQCQTKWCQNLNSFPLGNWRRQPGRPCTKWMKTIQLDMKSNNLSLNEAIVVTQNRPFWRLMSTFGVIHS